MKKFSYPVRKKVCHEMDGTFSFLLKNGEKGFVHITLDIWISFCVAFYEQIRYNTKVAGCI